MKTGYLFHLQIKLGSINLHNEVASSKPACKSCCAVPWSFSCLLPCFENVLYLFWQVTHTDKSQSQPLTPAEDLTGESTLVADWQLGGAQGRTVEKTQIKE